MLCINAIDLPLYFHVVFKLEVDACMFLLREATSIKKI